MDKQERSVYILFTLILAGLIIAGFLHQGFSSTLEGFLSIQAHPGRLINDFTSVGGAGSALLNAALTAAVGFILVAVSRVQLSGPTVAGILTMLGFGLFGKTPVNILPIIFGVFLSSKMAGKTFSEYLLIALFGTALGPLVSYLVVEFGLAGVPALVTGVLAGIITGMALPPVAIAMLHLHQGYNLYNMGLTCGFLGLFAASIITAARGDLTIRVIWNESPPAILVGLIPVLSAVLIIASFLISGRKTFGDFRELLKIPGRLPSDFMDMTSAGGSLLNMGLLGLLTWAYVFAVGGDFNGPVLGGMFTVIGFGSFGKHVKNVWPVMAGVVIACLVFGKSLSAPGPILATLFVTTLAPLAGEFGPVIGIIAGFLHLVMVERTAAWHGGMDLYNNGFAGGLTAALLVAIIEWYRTNRSDKNGKAEARKQ